MNLYVDYSRRPLGRGLEAAAAERTESFGQLTGTMTMQVRVFDQPETDSAVAMTNQEMDRRKEINPILLDAAVAANAAWLVVAVFYLLAEGGFEGGSLFIFLLAGIGFPLLNLLTVLQSEPAEWWED